MGGVPKLKEQFVLVLVVCGHSPPEHLHALGPREMTSPTFILSGTPKIDVQPQPVGLRMPRHVLVTGIYDEIPTYSGKVSTATR